MVTVTVRDLDDEVWRQLRLRAAGRGRSPEAEARTILTAAVAESIMAAPTAPDASSLPPPCPEVQLTPQEERVAALVAEGLTNRLIAARLYVSERTVETHVSAILRKLQVRNRATVASWWTRRAPTS